MLSEEPDWIAQDDGGDDDDDDNNGDGVVSRKAEDMDSVDVAPSKRTFAGRGRADSLNVTEYDIGA